jgi:hypothetical protein
MSWFDDEDGFTVTTPPSLQPTQREAAPPRPPFVEGDDDVEVPPITRAPRDVLAELRRELDRLTVPVSAWTPVNLYKRRTAEWLLEHRQFLFAALVDHVRAVSQEQAKLAALEEPFVDYTQVEPAEQVRCEEQISQLQKTLSAAVQQASELRAVAELVSVNPADDRAVPLAVTSAASVDDKMQQAVLLAVRRQEHLQKRGVDTVRRCVGTNTAAVSGHFWRERQSQRSRTRTQLAGSVEDHASQAVQRTLAHVASLRTQRDARIAEFCQVIRKSCEEMRSQLGQSATSLRDSLATQTAKYTTPSPRGTTRA